MYLLLFTHTWENDDITMTEIPPQLMDSFFEWVIRHRKHLAENVVEV